MVHSREFHGDYLDWEATVDSDEDLRAARVEVVGVTPMAIRRHPRHVLERIERVFGGPFFDRNPP